MLIPLVLIVANVLAWYPVLSFWFFKAWEQSWLLGNCGDNYNLLCLIKSHGILYLLNYKLFGWNPTGWYLTAILLHIITVLLVYSLSQIITKNKNLSFIIALIFGVNVAHNDVVNWGSFEGLYALMMTSFLLALIAYHKFQKAKTLPKFFWYGLIIFLFLFGLFIRESALVLPFFLLFFELFSKRFKLTKLHVIYLLKIFIPIFLISVSYLFFREWYGGAPHDFIDAMVQFRMTLIAQGLYGEYIWRGIISYGKYAGGHFIPYPLMNIIRDILSVVFNPKIINYYFFPVFGLLYTVLQAFLIWTVRKEKKVRNILIFSFLFFIVPTVFYSFSFTITDELINVPYTWNASRWRYFAFLGTVIYWVIFFAYIIDALKNKYKKKTTLFARIGIAAVILVFGLNFFLLRIVQKDIYLTTFKPEKDFYTKFSASFKTLPKNFVFYTFPYSSPVGDFLAEWYYLKKIYYPYLTEDRPDWGDSHMGMLLQRIQTKKVNINDVFFIDYDQKDGLLDLTADARRVLTSQKAYDYEINKELISEDLKTLDKKGTHQASIMLNPQLHVEIPYKIEVSVNTSSLSKPVKSNITESKEKALETYALNRIDFLRNSKVSTCKTAPLGTLGNPAMHFLPDNVIDGNIGNRSFWAADCRPAWIMIDLGKEKRVGAVAFHGSKNGPNLPGDYTILASLDGKSWNKIIAVNKNTSYQKIDKFSEIAKARFIKLSVDQTSHGAMLMLDAVEVIDEDSLPVLDFYRNDFEKLIFDSFQFSPGVLRFSWETDPNNFMAEERLAQNSMYTPLIMDGEEHIYTFEPNENEFYSASGQFLDRYITKLNFDLTGLGLSATISKVKIIPRFPIADKQ
ncbi:MAG: discoidin domain-containing protein [Candidatus Levybacteria bacterium]|nr:discoidin domain-containing protein [Candidatus Levybacteria bacterium]